uniref:Putative secreted protein n=1 Tax=Ixodes ricinus TaxID=34613 RepID=A0A6B0V2E0_IXORI
MTWRMTWYSSLMPLPPSMSLAARAMSKDLPHELRFNSDTISGHTFPSSMRRPTRRQPWRPREISVSMSANFFWISWFLASGDLNWIRSSVYCRAVSRQNSAAPRAPQEMPYLALVRHWNVDLSPRDFGSRASSGTTTSSMRIMPVVEARRENLPSILGASSPLVPFSSTKARIWPSSHLAQTTNTSAIGELVIHVLLPLRV